MSMNVRHLRDPGQTLAVTMERLSDRTAYDGKTFSAVGLNTKAISLTAMPDPWGGVYGTTIDTTGWLDGGYLAYVHLVLPSGALGRVVAIQPCSLYLGSDAPPPPAVVQITSPAGTIVTTK